MQDNDITLHSRSKALETQICVTRFPSQSAQKMRQSNMTIRELAARIENSYAIEKSKLPWFKLARFGSKRTEKNCLRHDANVLAVTGVEADYDGGNILLSEVERLLRKAGIAALVYTTASSKPDVPRWRIFAPFSEELPPDSRTEHMERLNGIFGGELDGASFALSQSYYGGNVEGSWPVETLLIEGAYIDQCRKIKRLRKGETWVERIAKMYRHCPSSKIYGQMAA